VKKLITTLLLLSGFLIAKDYALIVGISKYKDKNIGTLSYIDKDIQTYREILNQKGVRNIDIKELTNNQATKTEIKNYLEYVIQDIKQKDNRFFMFFAGHGINTKSIQYNSQILKARLDEYLTNSGVILPFEYDKENIANTIIIGKKDLRPYLEQIDKHIKKSLIIFDACYTGKSIRGDGDSTPFIYSKEKDYPYNNIVYIASATPRKKARSGVLSKVLNKCLSKLNNLQELRGCMNQNLKYFGQRATVISKTRNSY